ncbi:MAG: alpha/beta family hydrolase [Colwellia sp.]
MTAHTPIQEVIDTADGSGINILLNKVDNAIAQVIFAHGAGANMSHEFMNEITHLFNKSNINVMRFNFPFMDKRALTGKKYPPDRMPKLLTCYEAVIKHLLAQGRNPFLSEGTLPLFIGGKSMGSRVAATLVAESAGLKSSFIDEITGVFCLGYPFHPAKKMENLRLEPLLGANKPVLIIQGDRDTLGNKAEIISYQLPDHCQCTFLEDGDHSLKPRVKSGFTQQGHRQRAVDEIVTFIQKEVKCNNASHGEAK